MAEARKDEGFVLRWVGNCRTARHIQGVHSGLALDPTQPDDGIHPNRDLVIFGSIHDAGLHRREESPDRLHDSVRHPHV